MRYFKLAIIPVTLVVASLFNVSPTFASSSFGGYCGPPVTSKAAMLAFYKSPEGQPLARAAESWVRDHASYYHIQADQGFLNWLEQPNVKFFKAPPGYKLEAIGSTPANTYCPSDNLLASFSGHYDVGGLDMLWWCKDPTGEGHGCTPITKGYCRNFVAGPKIREHEPPVKKAKLVLVRTCKRALDVHGHLLKQFPAGIFSGTFTIKGHKTRKVTFHSTCETVGHYLSGTKINAKEMTPRGSTKWKLLNPEQQVTVSSKGNTITFVNEEEEVKQPEVPPALKTEVPPPTICSNTIAGNNNSGNTQSVSCKGICSNVNIGSNNTNGNIDCKCVGINVTCEENHEPPAKEPEHFTQVSCQLPEHIFVSVEKPNNADYMYCVATDDNEALISLDPIADKYAFISNQKSVDVRNQVGDPCPSGAQCFRVTILSGTTVNESPGSEITVKATANGAKAEPWVGFLPIVEDNFGT